MKAEDIGRIDQFHLTNIVHDSIPGDNWEVGKSLRFFCLFVCLLRGVDIIFGNNCRQYSWCWLYSTSERGKILNYKGLRQVGLIIPKRDLKSGACLWIPDLKFRLEVSLLGNVYF